MTPFALSEKERRLLEQIMMNTEDAHTLRRTQALLWLDDGENAENVADLLYLHRSVIYKWVKQFQERSALDIRARVSDGIRRGRPRTVHGVIDQLIEEVIDLDPRDLGYRPALWTAPLLAVYLDQIHHIKASPQSIRLAIERLRIRWKRPRHGLSERPATWRQAKGGLNAGSKGESGRLS
jgi:transposase